MIWAIIESQLAELATGEGVASRDAIANTRNLIAAVRDCYPVPDEATRGYWPTVNLCWNELAVPLVIEVHDEHYELYQFRDGATEIAHFNCSQQELVPAALMDELASCFGVR